MTRRAPPQRDLFGAPKAPPRDTTPVSVLLREVASSSTERAFFLAPMPGGRGKAGFAPRSEATRGEGVNANVFTMPRWLAAERGWA